MPIRPHVRFIGSTGACARLLPIAKKNLKHLTDIQYKDQRYWTWEKPYPTGHIKLERMGDSSAITIWSLAAGYEFSTALRGVGEVGDFVIQLILAPYSLNDPWTCEKGGDVLYRDLTDIKFTRVLAFTDPDSTEIPKGKHLEGRNFKGKVIDPLKDDFADQKDRFIYGRQWPDKLEATPHEAYIKPRLDWFKMPLPGSPEEAEARALNGYAGAKTISTATFRNRYTSQLYDNKDRGHWFENDPENNLALDHFEGPLMPDDFALRNSYIQAQLWHQGPPIIHSAGKGKVIDELLMHHVDVFIEEKFVYPAEHEPLNPTESRCSGAALQGTYLLCSSMQGEDYKFSLWETDRKEETELDMSHRRPDWVGGIGMEEPIWTKWYWRSDAKRCISLQYSFEKRLYDSKEKWERPPPNQGSYYFWFTAPLEYPPGLGKNMEVGIQELEWDILDAPVNEEGVREDQPPDVHTAVTLDVRGLNTRSDPVFPIAVDYDLFDGNIRRVIKLTPYIGNPHIDGAGINSYGTRPILIYADFCTIDDAGTISEPEYSVPLFHQPWLYTRFEARPVDTGFPYDYKPQIPDGTRWVDYFWSRGFTVPTSYRSGAFRGRFGYDKLEGHICAMDARARAMAIYTSLVADDNETVHYNQRWRIWGEEEYRENKWVDKDGLEAVVTDPYAPLVTPEGVPIIPAGYVKFVPGHPLWRYELIDTALHEVLQRCQSFEWATVYFIDGNPFNKLKLHPGDYTAGFRVHPSKNFALFVQLDHFPDDVNPSMGIDHIEHFLGYEKDEDGVLIEPLVPKVITGTHAEAHNDPRGTDVQFGSPGTFESATNTVIANNGIWVK